jgi:hypothetical protein
VLAAVSPVAPAPERVLPACRGRPAGAGAGVKLPSMSCIFREKDEPDGISDGFAFTK